MKFCPRCGEALVTREQGGKARLACPKEECGFVFWNNPIPVVAAIVERGPEVILVRNKGWPATWYGLVTGFLEEKESPDRAVLREVEEELGLAGSLVSLVGAYGFPEMNQVIVAYHVRAEGEIRMGEELADVKRVPTEKLRPWPTATGQAVADWLAKREK